MTDEQVNSVLDNQSLLFQWANEIEDLKAQLKHKQGQLESVMVKLGLNTYHQDPITGVVYKIYKPDGTFIAYKSIDVKRTALPGEKGGTVLAKSEAESMGFVLRK
jgi:hypothetical protein